MMQLLDWNKLNIKKRNKLSKVRKLTFVSGSIRLSKNRINQIKSNLSGLGLVFGCLKDEEIPGLEGSPQFQPLKLEDLQKALKGKKKNVPILYHFHKDLKYIIQELNPSKVIFVNGSWQGQIHYRSEYWKALDIGAKVELVSPFVNEREARKYEQSCRMRSTDRRYLKTKKYSDKKLIELAWKVSKFSWDWIGQVGAVLARNGKVLATGFNRVLPYQAYQMHFGSIREKKQIPAQEMIETQLTNHAELEILNEVRQKSISLKGTRLYTNLFPCPICAKMISQTEIEGIVYSYDHNLGNDFGYRVLEMSGKKIRRVVVQLAKRL